MEPDISKFASLIGDSTRGSILVALMSGKALTATELAIEAEVSTSTVSSHLSKLTQGRLLKVRKQGRHKYFTLANPEVAELIEKLMNVSSEDILLKVLTGPDDDALRHSRVCYDHLAGRVAVNLLDNLMNQEFITFLDGQLHLTEKGKLYFKQLGFIGHSARSSKRPVCRACLDWSERRDHIAGALGQWILSDILNKGWAIREKDSRVIVFKSFGLKQLKKQYNLTLDSSPQI